MSNNNITITKVPGGFIASCPDSATGQTRLGSGTTWLEAIGSLTVVASDQFNLASVEYASTELTIDYCLRHDLNKKIL